MKGQKKSKAAQPLTIAQQIYQSAPYHPASRHGERELRQEKEEKQKAHLLKINTSSASIVDGWMKSMLDQHKSFQNQTTIDSPSAEVVRQPRLGLGAKFVTHKKAVQIQEQTAKTTKGILKSVPIKPVPEQVVETEQPPVEEYDSDTEDSRTHTLGKNIKNKNQKVQNIPQPVGVSKNKKKKKKGKQKSKNWYL